MSNDGLITNSELFSWHCIAIDTRNEVQEGQQSISRIRGEFLSVRIIRLIKEIERQRIELRVMRERYYRLYEGHSQLGRAIRSEGYEF